MDLIPTPSPTTPSPTTKRYTRRDSDAPEVANLPLALQQQSHFSSETKHPAHRVSFQPTEYIPRSDPDYGSTLRRRNAFRRSKTFWMFMALVMCMCLAVGVGIGYAVGVNGARVVVHTPESVGEAGQVQSRDDMSTEVK